MTDDPIMRYIDVLKTKIQHIEVDCAEFKTQIAGMQFIIDVYSKVTQLNITIKDDDDDGRPQYD